MFPAASRWISVQPSLYQGRSQPSNWYGLIYWLYSQSDTMFCETVGFEHCQQGCVVWSRSCEYHIRINAVQQKYQLLLTWLSWVSEFTKISHTSHWKFLLGTPTLPLLPSRLLLQPARVATTFPLRRGRTLWPSSISLCFVPGGESSEVAGL